MDDSARVLPAAAPPPAAESEDSESPRSLAVAGPIDIRSTALVVLAVLSLVLFLHWSQTVLVPLVVSVLISYSLYPIVSALERLWIPRVLGAALLLMVIVALIGYASQTLRSQAEIMLDKVPVAVQKVRKTMRLNRHQAQEGVIEKVQEAAEEIQKVTEEAGGAKPAPPPGVTRVQIEQPAFNLRDYVWWGSVGVLVVAGQIATVLVLVFFFLVSGDLYKRKLVKITGPTLSKKKITVQILDDFNQQIRRYLFVMLISCIFVGVTTWLMFLWIGLEQAALWGVIAGVATVIPYLGPALVFAATGVLALAQFGTFTMALVVAFTSLIIASFQGWFLTPWLASKASKINTVAVFIGLLFWGWLWGVMGLVVAQPILIIIKVCCDRVENLKPVGELLGGAD
ncbi:MAG: AI-2E family transporter [Pseudomonadota bacterium]|nr:AI-2E family transporter [Pseudomonadota bacterium]